MGARGVKRKTQGLQQPYEMSRTYDLWNPERGASQRAMVIIDKEGIIRYRRVS
jgi:alkyl hydroperoxide reductase subunit AhpC